MPCSRQDFDHLPRRMAYHGAADHHHSRCNCVPLLPQHRNDLDRGTRISRCSSLNRLIGAPIQSLGRELIAVGDDNGWKRVLPPAPRNAVTFTGGGGAVGRIWQTKSNDRQDQTSEDDGVNRGRTVDVNVNVNVLLKTGFRRMVERLRFLTLGCCLLRAEGERPPDSATPQPEDCSRFVSIFPLPCLLLHQFNFSYITRRRPWPFGWVSASHPSQHWISGRGQKPISCASEHAVSMSGGSAIHDADATTRKGERGLLSKWLHGLY
jgi:hypothetical protein